MTIGDAERVLAGQPDDAGRWAGAMLMAARRLVETYANVASRKTAAQLRDPSPRGRTTPSAVSATGVPDEQGSVTIGYGLSPSCAANGYASEALRALLDLGAGPWRERVDGDTTHDNLASQRVMTAAGLRLTAEGTSS